ncbi:S8 family serine peptidase [Pseudoalteromonas piscicida]|uniref:Peptidase S8 n=1 Tax=Pseudoalteromonas piscicida TaxID=43662 RepID=A0A2A5JK24_PSEO7|nr:S8 family serine peptidase [Pseudoalteromonas piscicida]PCK29795.1 hypothetical protein CEX98_20960 [Pseudoalteromonas piscicida]
MKLKSITVATLAALYTSGIAASVPSSSIEHQAIPKLKQLVPQQSSQRTVESFKTSNRVKQNSGVNVQLGNKKVSNKFQPEPNVNGVQTYIVELVDNTVLTEYQQRVLQNPQSSRLGVLNTSSLKGQSLKSPQIASIVSEINRKQDQVLANATQLIGRQLITTQRFNKALNGFVTEMTQQEAMRLAKLGSVKKITRRQILQLNTDIGPSIIGANKVWQGETVSATPYKGKDIIAAVIDTGINTDHASFSPTGDDGYTVTNPWGAGNYAGDCLEAEFADRCNDKLIGVFSYDIITDQYSAREYQGPNWQEWMELQEVRPRFGEDYDGHGSHTASTLAGNVMHDVPSLQSTGEVEGDGIETGFRFSQVSGVAPHANIVAFQVCYSGEGRWSGCPSDALVAAIEDSIEIGVDVINFSIGSSAGSDPWQSPTQQAFLNAHKAGILVAASAGNSGTDGSQEIFGYIDNTSPWLMTVAASTTGRTLDVEGKSLTAFSGGDTTAPAEILGGSISGEITGNIVMAADFGDELCAEPFPVGTFNADDIVVCKRGEVARVAKAVNVQAGSGGGMILYNTAFSYEGTPEAEVVNDAYVIPGIHISAEDWNYSLLPWLSSGTGHMATITEGLAVRNVDPTQQDHLADFSSRGPAPYNPEHLVPSVTAPGVDIYAASADDQPFKSAPQSTDWAFLSGTSMASPHVAGALALIKEAHPDWSAAKINSALQMTADRVVEGRKDLWSPLEDFGNYRAGSGRINVANAINTGLVMDETVENFSAADPNNGGMPTRLNLPELVNLNCKSPCTWVREVTATRDGNWNIETTTSEYSVKLSAYPSSFSLKAGETQTIAITAEIVDSQAVEMNAEQEVWADVELVSDNPEIPTAYWPVAFKYDNGQLPDNINVEMHRDSGKYTLNNVDLPQVNDASYIATVPVKAEKQVVTLLQNTEGTFEHLKELKEDDEFFTIDVPEGAARLIVETLARTDSSTDTDLLPLLAGNLDVYVGIDLNGDGIPQWDEEAICASTSEVQLDYCNIDNPEAGTYWVVLDNAGRNWDPDEHWDTLSIPVQS